MGSGPTFSLGDKVQEICYKQKKWRHGESSGGRKWPSNFRNDEVTHYI